MLRKEQTTLGLIVGNRGFFPDHLCESGRETLLEVLGREGFKVVALTPDDTKLGCVQTREDAKKCAALFGKNSGAIDGILVSLPNFGDERSVVDILKMSRLDVPILVHAFPDELDKMALGERRDSFCGKISVCNNLKQHGLRYSLTSEHVMDPESDQFREDLRSFAACCRVVNGLRGARIGAIGARPAAFNTVRYSEKILEAAGISVETIDLFEVFGKVDSLDADDARVKAKLQAVRDYIDTSAVSDEALLRMARFGAVVDEWVAERELDATAIQCWTAIERFFGIVPCAVMSMLSERLLPCACEVDITGAVGMLALCLATGKPSALLDWNNNYGDDPDMCVFFHCSNLPKSVFADVRMTYQGIIATAVGKENAYGTCAGRIAPGPLTYARVGTDDLKGTVRAYVGEAEVVDVPLRSFGGYGVARVPNLQGLLRHICANGLEHHVAMAQARVGRAVHEALADYSGWDVYWHST